jgi:SAM-dependent methyltransferase
MGYLLPMSCKNCVTPKNWNPNWINWQVSQPLSLAASVSAHLDLGSGARPSNPFKCKTLIASDVNPSAVDVEDLNFSFVQITDISNIPLADKSVDTVSAFDLLEHIPRSWPSNSGEYRNPFIEIMNEIHRVLKPGGVFLAVTPAFPSPQAFQDPTHVNIISEETISYFDENAWATTLGYGYTGRFSKVHQSWLRGSGPYLGRFPDHFSPNDWERNSRIVYRLRILNRLLRLAKKKNTFALLWVLRKECDC